MINFLSACKIAFDYFLNVKDKKGLCKALETDDYWIFYGGSEKEIEIGGSGIKVDKYSGKVSIFKLPSLENFKLLHEAKFISIPEEFLSNAQLL